MFRLTTTVLLLSLGTTVLRAEEGRDSVEKFEKQSQPIVAGIGRCTKVVVYEGLPHQFFEKELLDAEKKSKKTVEFQKYPFYAEQVSVTPETAKKLLALGSDRKSYQPWQGEKLCGGYHPDWCVEFRDGDTVYRALICFGCHEAILAGPKNEVRVDLNDDSFKQFSEILAPLRKNRPQARIAE